ncbi:diamine acetyltransferase 2 [Exaiptasia diaphana]|uniref:N-acetyltransferase domain-containing protein n=1 Tax=Exaiptasia diaphana TaxID=2652724 RepID=A0A913XQN2_EXADI|nr:diamine acetyltransferase 2 [Exaiptasia diaphana]KXJ09988.1 Diamine acetyltransferase 2 [Exaiptasia diaphana]
MSWTIREAALDDAAAVIQFIKDMIAYHDMSQKYKGICLEEFIQDCFGTNPWVNCIVAGIKEDKSDNEEKKLIGFCTYYYTFNSKLGRGIYMNDLFVIPSERGKGIGLCLMKSVIKISVRKGCSYMNWDITDANKSAINFYERLGAKIDGKTSFMSLCGDALYKLIDDNN